MALSRLRRISLRSMFFLTTVIAVGVAIYLRQARINETVSGLIAKGAKVQYHPTVIPGLSELFGGFFADAKSIDLSHSRVENDDLQSIHHLKRLECLYLPRTSIKQQGVEAISQVGSLRRLALWGNRNVGEGCVGNLLKLDKLEVLDLHKTRVHPSSLSRLMELPSLKHLVFSADFTSSENTWIGEDDISQLTQIRATPVGNFYCREMTDAGLAQLKSLDTSRLTNVIVRDSKISSIGLRQMHGLKLRRLSIQSCPITDKDLDSISWDTFDRVTLSGTAVTLSGLGKCLGDRCKSIEFNHDMFSLYREPGYHSAKRIVKFFPADTRVSAEALRALTALESLSFSSQLYPDILEALKDANPRVRLSVFLPRDLEDDLFWQAIAEMDRLTGLSVRHPPPGMAFTPAHQLQHLTLRGKRVIADEAALQEIGKLKKLRFLGLANHEPIGNQARHLTQLKNLRTLRVDGMTDDALKHTPQMSITSLDINAGELITEKGLRFLENRTFAVEIGNRRFPGAVVK